MANRIDLSFRKDLTKLAGNSFGKNTYLTQVKDKIDFSENIVFILPQQIDRIASSFVQGFFEEIFRQMGLKGIIEKVDFESSISDLKQFVIDNLE